MPIKLSRKSAVSEGETPSAAGPVGLSAADQAIAAKLNARPRGEALTGLDIAGDRIAAATVSGGRIKAASYMAISPGLVVNGEIIDPEALGAEISNFLAASGLPRRVRIGLASPRVVIRTLEMPVIADLREFDAAVRFQAADHLPMAVDEVVIDYQVVETIPPDQPGEHGRFRVVLVAASRELIDKVLATANAGGIDLRSIDLSAFGLVRALYQGQMFDEETLCYTHVADMLNVTLARGTTCRFTRATSNGLSAAATRLMDREQLTREHAEMWLEHVGLSQPLAEIAGEAEVVAAARDELLTMAEHVCNDVMASVDFHDGQPGATRVSRILLVGPGARIPGLDDALTRGTGLPVSAPAPLGALDARDIESPDVDLSRLTLAAGLALEEVVAQ